eukprot:9474531-Pyramimonas_sp.AAC.1
MARGAGSVNAKTQYKGGAGSSQAGKGSATPSDLGSGEDWGNGKRIRDRLRLQLQSRESDI